jgi:hypothetical protein
MMNDLEHKAFVNSKTRLNLTEKSKLIYEKVNRSDFDGSHEIIYAYDISGEFDDIYNKSISLGYQQLVYKNRNKCDSLVDSILGVDNYAKIYFQDIQGTGDSDNQVTVLISHSKKTLLFEDVSVR